MVSFNYKLPSTLRGYMLAACFSSQTTNWAMASLLDQWEGELIRSSCLHEHFDSAPPSSPAAVNAKAVGDAPSVVECTFDPEWFQALSLMHLKEHTLWLSNMIQAHRGFLLRI